ncbi:MAG: Crp/Fnr family transcriptional regulator [Pseudomonadota bacterium]
MAKGAVLSREQQAALSLITVTAGLLQVSVQRPGEAPRTIGFHFPGDIVALGDEDLAADLEIKALLPVRAEGMGAAPEGSQSPGVPDIWERLCRQLALEQRARSSYAFDHIDGRLAAFFLRLTPVCSNGDEARPVVHLPMRRNDLADYLGIRTETLSRHLTNWRASGVIQLPSPRTAVLRDRAYLEALAAGR